MPLVFEPNIHFEAADNTAIVWADDDKGGRFRLSITRQALTDRFGYKGAHFDDKAAAAHIKKCWPEIEDACQKAYAAGKKGLSIE